LQADFIMNIYRSYAWRFRMILRPYIWHVTMITQTLQLSY